MSTISFSQIRTLRGGTGSVSLGSLRRAGSELYPTTSSINIGLLRTFHSETGLTTTNIFTTTGSVTINFVIPFSSTPRVWINQINGGREVICITSITTTGFTVERRSTTTYQLVTSNSADISWVAVSIMYFQNATTLFGNIKSKFESAYGFSTTDATATFDTTSFTYTTPAIALMSCLISTAQGVGVSWPRGRQTYANPYTPSTTAILYSDEVVGTITGTTRRTMTTALGSDSSVGVLATIVYASDTGETLNYSAALGNRLASVICMVQTKNGNAACYTATSAPTTTSVKIDVREPNSAGGTGSHAIEAIGVLCLRANWLYV